MRSNNTVLNNDEMSLLDELEYGDFVDKPLSNQEIKALQESCKIHKIPKGEKADNQKIEMNGQLNISKNELKN